MLLVQGPHLENHLDKVGTAQQRDLKKLGSSSSPYRWSCVLLLVTKSALTNILSNLGLKIYPMDILAEVYQNICPGMIIAAPFVIAKTRSNQSTCQCHSLTSSQLTLLPPRVLKSILYLCIFIPVLPLGSSEPFFFLDSIYMC